MAIADETIWAILLVIFVDFNQAVEFGVITGIGKQKPAMLVQFISVFCIITPLGYYIAFVWFEHDEYLDKAHPNLAQSLPGLGVAGLWMSIVCGYTFQIIAFYFLLLC